MITSRIFEPREHYVTIVHRDGKKNARRLRIKNPEQLERLIEQQVPNTDMYITKYARKDIVWNIILDFDDGDNPNNAYNEALTLRKFLMKKGINVVIVDSTNKGVHCYVEIPPTSFRLFYDDPIEEPSVFFKNYVSLLCNLDVFKFKTLDEVNYNAGLDGNIRVIDSIHPKTNKRVCIVEGEFHDIDFEFEYYEKAMHYHTLVYKKAYDCYKRELEEIEVKRLQYRERLKTSDDLLNKDLRDVFRELFHLERVREYGDNIWCSCPFHPNHSVQFCVNPQFFFCSSCGIKGNIFTLIKMGLIEPPKTEYWLTEGVKCKH